MTMMITVMIKKLKKRIMTITMITIMTKKLKKTIMMITDTMTMVTVSLIHTFGLIQ